MNTATSLDLGVCDFETLDTPVDWEDFALGVGVGIVIGVAIMT